MDKNSFSENSCYLNKDVLEKNKITLDTLGFRLKKDYSHSLKKGEKILIPERRYSVDNALKKTKDTSRAVFLTAGASIVLCATVGIICLSPNLILNLIPPERIDLLDKFTKLAGECSKVSSCSFDILSPLVSATIIPSLSYFFTSTALKDRDHMFDYKYLEQKRQKERAFSRAVEIDEVIQIIKDIEIDRDDISLSFIKDFFSNVDVSENSKDFNLLLLGLMADFRVANLKYQNSESKKETVEDAFSKIVETLATTTRKDGASESFIRSDYVNKLVDTYYESPYEKDFVLEPVKKSKQVKA